MTTTRPLIPLTALALLCGCQAPQQKAQVEATQRWNVARAQVKARLAADQFAAGDLAAAAKEMNEARKLDPENPALVPLQARIWLAEGKLGPAAALLEKAGHQSPPDAEAVYLLGVVRQQQEKWDAALAAYEQAAALEPAEPHYAATVAQTYLQRREPQRALEFLDSVAASLSWLDDYQAARAEACEQAGDWAGAATAWQRIAQGPGADVTIRERLADALYRAGRFDEAVPLLEALCDQPDAGAARRNRVQLVEGLLAAGRPAAAREQAQALVQGHPNDAPALRLLARTLAAEGDCAAARRVIGQALAADADDPLTMELAAALAWREGEFDAAAALAGRLAQRQPGNVGAARILERAAQR